MSNVLELPVRNPNPPEPPKTSYCNQCGTDLPEQTWALGAQNLCRPHALLVVAEATMDGFGRLDCATAVMHRDILNASLEELEERIKRLTGGQSNGF